MRRLLLCLVVAAALTAPLCAQERSETARAGQPESGRLLVWKWINFGVLIAGLGYLVAKNAPAFFNARTAEIQKAIKDATGLKLEADFRISEIDRKMATLDAEIRHMRDASRAEMQQESARIDRETSFALEKIHEHTAREIESLQHLARNTLREHAVQLAVSLAGAQLRENLTPEDRDRLVRTFASSLASQGASA